MATTPDIVYECIICGLSVLPYIQTDTVTTVSHEWLKQSGWNLQGIFTSPYWWPD